MYCIPGNLMPAAAESLAGLELKKGRFGLRWLDFFFSVAPCLRTGSAWAQLNAQAHQISFLT
jgi:hypothetical protein